MTTMYNWIRKYDEFGEEGLLRKKREPNTYWNSTDKKIVALILKLREEYQLGPWRIKWYFGAHNYSTLNGAKALCKSHSWSSCSGGC